MRALRDGRTLTYDQEPPPDAAGDRRARRSSARRPVEVEVEAIAIAEVRGDADDVHLC